ncbi:MAG: alanine racemase [Gemmatimonadota bacterium]|nr:alanine racemase [Gemmatimonadota bacterium]
MTPDIRERWRAWVEVDLDALVRNARRIEDRVAPAGLLPMVKADGYGLGAVAVARALEAIDPWAFGVASAAEGAELRRAGIGRRVVVFSPSPRTESAALEEHGLDAAVIGPAGLAELSALEVPLHIEIDTGMGRAGLDPGRVDAWGPRVRELTSAGRVASIYTHFHSAASDAGSTRAQLSRFEAVLAALGVGDEVPIPRLAANSDAIRSDPQYHLDLVRPGLYLYGGGRGSFSGTFPDPEPVVAVRARVLEVRDLPPGSTVSYGATYVAESGARLATLAVGYADGLPWSSGNTGTVLVRGGAAPVRGRVCMDVTVVDVSRVPRVEPGDVATLVGQDGEGVAELADLAARSGTIEYEVLTGLGGRLPRIYLRGGVPMATSEADVGNR